MKTIQMEIDEDLLAEVERAIRESGTTRVETACAVSRQSSDHFQK